VAACRYFMKDYQFTTDTYRMFAALTRLCQSPISWYSSGPTQKYMLRQIKAMDYGLVDDECRQKYFAEKGSYSAQDEAGRLIVNKDMDVALLMVYGHILYTGTSYAYALSKFPSTPQETNILLRLEDYFFRAYALDSENPMITLSIGLGYVHYGLKRQAENRQFHIMQGLSFLMKYYQSRHSSPRAEERQEASYNIARAYHMLGLTHLALPYYMEVLAESQDKTIQDELVIDAAYNLQAIYAIGGDLDMAQAVTNTYLNV
jgi:general transcription factor 3C polypeptide 3 (transcription factor C subunit 4)